MTFVIIVGRQNIERSTSLGIRTTSSLFVSMLTRRTSVRSRFVLSSNIIIYTPSKWIDLNAIFQCSLSSILLKYNNWTLFVCPLLFSRRSFLCWRWKNKIFLHCSTNNRLRWNGRIIVVTIISRHEKHSSHDKCRPLLRRFHIFSPPSLTRDSSGAMVDIIQSYFSWEFLIPSP